MNVFLSGETVFLRALSTEDVTPEYLRWVNDPEVTRGMVTGTYPSTLANLHHYVKAATEDPNTLLFAICDKKNGQHIGNIKLDRFDYVSGTCELGLMIGNSDYHGKGIGREVCQLVTDYAFQRLNLRKISLTVYSNNEAAIRLYKRIGFVEEGCLKQHVYLNGHYIDKYWMSLFRKAT
jgi:UDP-4-amino-4,6-dideoxy-N-acetyl-beta-L-altrosamine N-acetyltransferase